MSGKPKDPTRTYSSNWGGAHPGGNKPGRKPNPYPPQSLHIRATDEEKEEIERLTARQRAEVLLKEVRKETNNEI